MSKFLEKKFVNVGVQSPSEFLVTSDELSTHSVSHTSTDEEVAAKSRVDGIVQTEDSVCEFAPLGNKSQKTLVITVKSSCNQGKSSEKLNRQILKKIKKKGMDKNSPDALTTRTTSDLERRKLEAELKATEEIAKIKQSVIEKRLELELATLQDCDNPKARLVQQSPKNKLNIIDSSLEKNEKPTEAEKSGSEFKNPFMPSLKSPSPPVQAIRTPFPPILSQVMPPSQCVRDFPKTKSLKNDSDFLIKNEIKSLKLGAITSGSSEQKNPRPANLEKPKRNFVLPERGIFMQTIEKPKYSPPPQMGPNPFKMLPEEKKYIQMSQMPVTEAYYANRMPEQSVNVQQDQNQPGCSPAGNRSNSISVFKTMVSKMKKKFKK